MNGKVDKDILKNLFLSYFAAPNDKKNKVAHLLGSILGFTPEEFQVSTLRDMLLDNCWKALCFQKLESGSGWLNFLRSLGRGAGGGGLEQSLALQFVKFLEAESAPKPDAKTEGSDDVPR